MGNPAFEARHSGSALADILSRTGERAFDIVHDHSGFMVVAAAGLLPLPPVLHTIHSAFDEVTTGFYDQYARSVAYNAISEYQRSMGPAGMNLAGVVPNAIDLACGRCRRRRTTTCWRLAASARPRAFTWRSSGAPHRPPPVHGRRAAAAVSRTTSTSVIEPELDDQIVFLG